MVATTGGIPEIETMSLGKKVQYPIRNKTAQIKIEGTHALVRTATKSPINKIRMTMTNASICDIPTPNLSKMIIIFRGAK
jgi:hypothetical protein